MLIFRFISVVVNSMNLENSIWWWHNQGAATSVHMLKLIKGSSSVAMPMRKYHISIKVSDWFQSKTLWVSWSLKSRLSSSVRSRWSWWTRLLILLWTSPEIEVNSHMGPNFPNVNSPTYQLYRRPPFAMEEGLFGAWRYLVQNTKPRLAANFTLSLIEAFVHTWSGGSYGVMRVQVRSHHGFGLQCAKAISTHLSTIHVPGGIHQLP